MLAKVLLMSLRSNTARNNNTSIKQWRHTSKNAKNYNLGQQSKTLLRNNNY